MKKKSMLIFFLLLLLPGCNRYTEVNQLGIVEVLSITKEQEKIKETISYVVPFKEEENQENQYKTLSYEGSSLANTYFQFEEEDGKKLYFDQVQVLLCNKALVQDEFDDLIPFLLKNLKHPNLLIFLCEDCDSILKKEKTKTFYENLIRSKSIQGQGSAVITFEDVAAFYLDEDLTPAIPFLKKKEDTIEMDSLLALSSKNSFHRFSKKEAEILFLLKNKLHAKEEVFSLQGKNKSIFLKNLETSMKLKDDVIHLTLRGTYQEKDSIPKKQEKKIASLLSQRLEQEIKDFLQKEKKEGTDLLGVKPLLLGKYRNRSKVEKLKKEIPYKIQITLNKEGDLFAKS